MARGDLKRGSTPGQRKSQQAQIKKRVAPVITMRTRSAASAPEASS